MEKKPREIRRDKEVFFEAETIHQWKNRIVWKNLLILLQKAFFSRLEKIDASPEAFCLINRELMRIEIYGTVDDHGLVRFFRALQNLKIAQNI